MPFTPYRTKSSGDALRLQDWLEVQRLIKQELREHRHLGATDDGRVDPRSIGPRIAQGALAPGAVTSEKLAPRAVGPLALAPDAVRAEHFDPGRPIPEQALRFRPDDGHDHDGVNSRALPAGAIGTGQLADGAVEERHLAGAPAESTGEYGEDYAGEETYATGPAATPGNILRAARELLEHVGLRARPLLVDGAYRSPAGVALLVRGFGLTGLPRDAALELRFTGPTAVQHVPLEVVDERRLRVQVPRFVSSSGAEVERTGTIRVMRGAGTEASPRAPLTNAVPFVYLPATP